MRRLAGLALAALLAGACSDGPVAGAKGPGAKLAQVRERGTLVLSTDLEYAPQSFAVRGAERAPGSRCEPGQLTAPEVTGFDAETGKAVARALGVEPCFVSPTWVEITAGGWGDRWDLSFGSGAIETERLEALHVTQPYYVLPAYLYVPSTSTARTPEDLSGATIGACTSCSHEFYLRRTLQVPGFSGGYRISDPRIETFAVEAPGLEATSRGELDAFLCAEQVGRRAIADGLDLRPVGDALFVEHATGWVDRRSELDVRSFVRRVDEVVADLHARGVLSRLSEQWFGRDYTAEAAEFDLASVTGAGGGTA